MLSEEEKKAIDELIMLKHFLETEERYEGQEREVNAIKIVLKLITKLQKENEEKDKQIDLMLDKIDMTKPSPCTMTNEYSIRRVYMSKEEKRQYFEAKAKGE